MISGTSWAFLGADFGRYAGGGLLVLSAALKFLFPEYSTSESMRLSSPHWYTALIVGEVALGVSVLFRLFHGVEVILATTAYAAFTVVNVWSVSAGRVTCGCLGSITVNPKVMLVLDAVLTACLALSLATNGVHPRVRWRRLLVLSGIAIGLVTTVWLAGGRDSIVALLIRRDVYLEVAAVDLGELRSGEVVEVPLRLCNRSSHQVRVVGLSESVAIRPPAQTWAAIEPGTTGEVPVTVTFKRLVGRQAANAILFVDHGGQLREVPFTIVWVVPDR